MNATPRSGYRFVEVSWWLELPKPRGKLDVVITPDHDDYEAHHRDEGAESIKEDR